MSSNFYVQYDPYFKSKDSMVLSMGRTAPAHPPPYKPLIQNLHMTQGDGSAIYTRFIPPPSKSQPQLENSPVISSSNPSKRNYEDTGNDGPEKKRVQKGNTDHTHENGDDKIDLKLRKSLEETGGKTEGNNKALEKKSNKNKRSKANLEISSTPQEEVELGHESVAKKSSKHKSLLSKRAKSINKAEKFARKAAEEAGSGEVVEKDVEDPPQLHPLEPLPQPEPVIESSKKDLFSALPLWLKSPIRISSTATEPFSKFGLPQLAIEFLRAKGFDKAFAVQAAVLPLLLPRNSERVRRSGDLLVSAATGSGKTLAYALPIVEDICKTSVTRLRGLIVMPTRELVTQVKEVCEMCALTFSAMKRRHIKVGTAVGNQALKTEQVALMFGGLRYDPKEYQEQERRLNSKWESSDQDADDNSWDENFNMYDEDTVSRLPNHVTEYTSKVDILICTPGRLVEHLKFTPGFTLDYLKWLVIDEADKLLDQSFQQWLPTVMSALPKAAFNPLTHSVTKIVLSATMTRDVGQLNELNLFRPRLVVLEGSEELETIGDGRLDESLSLPATLIESAVKVSNDTDKPLHILRLLRNTLMTSETSKLYLQEQDSSDSSSKSSSSEESFDDEVSEAEFSYDTEKEQTREKPSGINNRPIGTLIFTKSNEAAVRLGRLISLLKPSLEPKIGILTSTIPHSTRKSTLASFNSGEILILFASDLVSRGLDLPNLAHVINYDMPTSLTNYVHRVGRTARAGKEGHAWTLFSNTEARWFWNDIARSSQIIRTARKVERVNVDASVFGDEERERYERALVTLGQEAGRC